MDLNVEKYTDQAVELMMGYGPRLILAIITLFVGLWVIKIVGKGFGRMLQSHDIEESLESFLISLSGMILKVLLVVSVAGMIGVEMTSFIAILGAAGLAVGMALSGTLQNFAGGVIILILKPYKVGDVIEAQGFVGKVHSIQIFSTILKTPDNKTIVIPNSPLSTGALINYSVEKTRRADLTFGIGYDDDIDQAKAVLMQIIEADSRIHKDPEPFIGLSELADSSVNFVVRVWTDSGDLFPVSFDMREAVKKEFDKQGISIPYPQQDVHLHQGDGVQLKQVNA